MPVNDRRKNRKRKTRNTTFKPGHKPWISNIKTTTTGNQTEFNQVSSSKPVSRPNKRLYQAAFNDYQGPEHTVPSKLRPAKDEQPKESHISDSSENIIVNLEKLIRFIKLCSSHQCKHGSHMNVSVTKRMGLCITMTAACENCAFYTDPYKLFNECDRKTSRGPNTGSLNESLTLAIQKTKMGASDLLMCLACLDVKAPAASLIYSNINRQCDMMVQLNEMSMVENQVFVSQVKNLLHQPNEVDVETDASFNNRNQAGYEGATQSFCPLIEKNTGLNLPLAMATANKLCNKNNACDHNDNDCKKSYHSDDTISSSEAKLAIKNLESVNNMNIVKIRSVTSDASAQLGKVVKHFRQKSGKSIRHYQCFVHRMRTLHKNLNKITFSKLPTSYDRDTFRQKLAVCVRSRVRLELVRIHKRCTEQDFSQIARLAIKNIIPCLSGNHANCKENSVACRAHLETYNTKFLPYGTHLILSVEDKRKFEETLDKSLSLDILNKIACLHTTNQCESLHHRVFTYAPKSVLHKRNFNALCHSACHSSTFGSGKSSVLLAKSLGLNFSKCAPFFKFMIRKDILALYHSQRKKTAKYKIQLFLAKCRRRDRKIRKESLYTHASEEVNEIHNYGINLNNK